MSGTATLPAPPSSNKLTRTILLKGGRPARVKTGAYKRWLTLARAAFRAAGGPLGRTPSTVSIEAAVSRRRDLDNLAKPCLDALVSAGLLDDDRWCDAVHLVRATGPEGADLVRVTWQPCDAQPERIERPPDMPELAARESPAEKQTRKQTRRPPAPPPAPLPFEDAWSAALEAEDSAARKPAYKRRTIQDHGEVGRAASIAHGAAWRAGGGPEAVALACERAAAYCGAEAAAVRAQVDALGSTRRDLGRRGGLASGTARRTRNARRDADILRLAAEGKGDTEIARELAISRKAAWRVRQRHANGESAP